MNQLDTIDTINEVRLRIEGIVALIGEPANMSREAASCVCDLLSEQAERLSAVSDALGAVATD